MKKVLFFLLLSQILLACKNNIGGQEHLSYSIELQSHKVIDETQIVHSSWPKSLTTVGDSTLACIVDFKKLCFYNLNNGALLNSLDVDSVLIASGFNIEDFIKKNCIDFYKDREYETNKDTIESHHAPLFKTAKIASSINVDGSISLLINILTPYKKAAERDGLTQMVTYVGYSLAVVDVDPYKKSIVRIIPIKMDLLDIDKETGKRMGIEPLLGGSLINDKLYVTVMPNFSISTPPHEIAVFKLDSPQACHIPTLQYDSIMKPDWRKWIPNRIFLKEQSDNSILFNTNFGIDRITQKNELDNIAEFKSKFDLEHFEHIISFGKLNEETFIVQSQIYLNGEYYYFFYNFDLNNHELHKTNFIVKSKTITPDIIYKKDKIIFITRDEEHYYIDTYKVLLH